MRCLTFSHLCWLLFASVVQALSTLVINLRKLDRLPEKVTYVFHMAEHQQNIWRLTPEEMLQQTSSIKLLDVAVVPGRHIATRDTHLTRPFSGVILWWGEQYEKYSVAENNLVHYPEKHQIILYPRKKVSQGMCAIM